jgi:UDP-N-acetylmuramoyl-tripeptide--D-alanyl-D-alanine ligase
MIELDAAKITSITNGKHIRTADTLSRIRFIATDSRIIEKESCFLALKGDHFNGHDFIAEVLNKGITDVCVDKESSLPKEGHFNAVLVENTLKAYQDIAAWQRINHTYRVVGITGSVGKTSTREMIRAALSSSVKVHSTKHNFNNQIGLPQSILEAPDDSDVCVLEMGMRALGEIHELALVAKPDIAIITNIGVSHIEYLKSKDNIFRAKKEIFEGLRLGGLAILNADDPYLADYSRHLHKTHRTCLLTRKRIDENLANVCLSARNIESGRTGIRFFVEINDTTRKIKIEKEIHLPVPGVHHVTNALFALAVSYEMGLDLDLCIDGMQNYQSIGSRQNLIQCGSISLIDDSYNASPESMEAAIALLKDIAGSGRTIALMAGMLELGEYSFEEHRKLGTLCLRAGIDIVYVFGEIAKPIIQGIEDTIQEAGDTSSCDFYNIEYHYYDDMDLLLESLRKKIRGGDSILVKGSRLYRMETVVRDLENRFRSGKEGDKV